MHLSTSEALAGALGITILLAALHALAPRIRRLPLVPEAVIGSFAGGIAVAYVFVHLLPELVEGQEALAAVLDDVVEPTPLIDLAIFLVALAGLTLFYGLDRLAHHSGEGSARPYAAAFWLHLGAFMVYNGIITYTMALRLRTGIAFALLFAIAIGLHFVLTDRTLEEHYPRRFSRFGRPLLVAALLVGWLLAAFAAPTRVLPVVLLTAFIGGSILLNVFREELPAQGRASFPWFLTGAVLYSGLLALTTAAAG